MKLWRSAIALCAGIVLAGSARAEAPIPKTVFDAMTGCWSTAGVLRGKPFRQLAQGRWVLDQKYFLLQFVSARGDKPYGAAWFFGRDAKGGVVVHLLDIFGGEYSKTLGLGDATASRISTLFDYPDGPTRNVITLEPGGTLRMLITETPSGKPQDVFSDARFTRAACGKAVFPL
jgi:hypothetical protein